MIGLSESVRAELRGTGVEITVVMPGFAKTELASGVPDLRMVKRVTPEEIADATVAAIKVPRFDVWAPKRLAGIITLGAVLPRNWREAVSRAMNSNRVVTTDPRARAAYEARANASAPAVDEISESQPSEPASPRGSRRSPRRDPPGGSDRRPRSVGAPGGRARRRRSRRPTAAAAGPRRPTASGSGASRPAARASTRLPSFAPGSDGLSGTSSGNARAPALLASFGNGAS